MQIIKLNNIKNNKFNIEIENLNIKFYDLDTYVFKNIYDSNVSYINCCNKSITIKIKNNNLKNIIDEFIKNKLKNYDNDTKLLISIFNFNDDKINIIASINCKIIFELIKQPINIIKQKIYDKDDIIKNINQNEIVIEKPISFIYKCIPMIYMD